jgi:heat shock protein HslJ
MKTNYIYIAGIIVIAILGFILWNKGDSVEMVDDITNTATTTTTTTNTSTATKKPATSATASKPQASVNVTVKPATKIPSNISLSGSIFRLTSYNGVSIPLEAKYTVYFENGSLSAKFCNSLSGEYVLDGTSIKVANLISTKMYCSTPSNLMEIESAFGSMLNFGAKLVQNGNTLTLSDPKGVTMVFTGFSN